MAVPEHHVAKSLLPFFSPGIVKALKVVLSKRLIPRRTYVFLFTVVWEEESVKEKG